MSLFTEPKCKHGKPWNCCFQCNEEHNLTKNEYYCYRCRRYFISLDGKCPNNCGCVPEKGPKIDEHEHELNEAGQCYHCSYTMFPHKPDTANGGCMTNYDIVKKLIGEINPVGETNTDEIRFKNLQNMALLVEHLLHDINKVSYDNIKREELSIKKAALFAQKFLTSQGIS